MSAPALSRNIFKTSRLAEFTSEKELVKQTGHSVDEWPLVVLKELVDNGIDASEEAGVSPVVEIKVSHDGISVVDYASRVSSREAYVSPTRGAQGNALQTILAMPFALDSERGETVIESRGVAHRIMLGPDRDRFWASRRAHIGSREPEIALAAIRPRSGRRELFGRGSSSPGLRTPEPRHPGDKKFFTQLTEDLGRCQSAGAGFSQPHV